MFNKPQSKIVRSITNDTVTVVFLALVVLVTILNSIISEAYYNTSPIPQHLSRKYRPTIGELEISTFYKWDHIKIEGTGFSAYERQIIFMGSAILSNLVAGNFSSRSCGTDCLIVDYDISRLIDNGLYLLRDGTVVSGGCGSTLAGRYYGLLKDIMEEIRIKYGFTTVSTVMGKPVMVIESLLQDNIEDKLKAVGLSKPRAYVSVKIYRERTVILYSVNNGGTLSDNIVEKLKNIAYSSLREVVGDGTEPFIVIVNWRLNVEIREPSYEGLVELNNSIKDFSGGVWFINSYSFGYTGIAIELVSRNNITSYLRNKEMFRTLVDNITSIILFTAKKYREITGLSNDTLIEIVIYDREHCKLKPATDIISIKDIVSSNTENPSESNVGNDTTPENGSNKVNGNNSMTPLKNSSNNSNEELPDTLPHTLLVTLIAIALTIAISIYIIVFRGKQ